MNLPQDDIALFYKLWFTLIWGVNQKHSVTEAFEKPSYGQCVNQDSFLVIRNEMWKNPHWINEFLSDSEYGELNEMERGILARWQNEFISGCFLIMQHTAKYSVFMDTDKNSRLFGVCGITDSFKEMVSASSLPFMIETVLLPFKDRIIYDSLMNYFNVSFGRGMRSGFKESYDDAKKRYGIIERMGVEPIVTASTKRKTAVQGEAIDTGGVNVPKAMASRYMEIAKVIEVYCDLKLADEYKEMCLKVLAKLARKRPSPLVSGRTNTWACGVVYVVAAFNGGFDKSKQNHLVENEVADWFGIAKRTASNQIDKIDELLGLSYSRMDITVRET